MFVAGCLVVLTMARLVASSESAESIPLRHADRIERSRAEIENEVSQPNFTTFQSVNRAKSSLEELGDGGLEDSEEIDPLMLPRVDYNLYPYYDESMDDLESRRVDFSGWTKEDWDRDEEKWKDYPFAVSPDEDLPYNPIQTLEWDSESDPALRL